MAYELATGHFPFGVPPVQEVASTGAWSGGKPDTSGLPAPFDTIAARCLDARPGSRMSAAEALSALRDE